MKKWITATIILFIIFVLLGYLHNNSSYTSSEKIEIQSTNPPATSALDTIEKQEVSEPSISFLNKDQIMPAETPFSNSLYPKDMKVLHATVTADKKYELAFLGTNNFGQSYIYGKPYTNKGKIVPAIVELTGYIIDANSNKHIFNIEIGPELLYKNEQVVLWLKDIKNNQTQIEISSFLGYLEVGMSYKVEIYANPLSVAGITPLEEIDLLKNVVIDRNLSTEERKITPIK